MKCRVHIIVSGVVQGVGFRFFVYDVAKSLNLTGYVRNLYSGQVEIEAEGERGMVEELISAVKVGPRLAHVTDLDIKWIECTNKEDNFRIL